MIVSSLSELGDRGFPSDHRRLKEVADRILRSPSHLGPSFEGVGVNWTSRFVERHHDKLKTYWSSGLDNKRGRAVNPVADAKWQELLKNLLVDLDLQAEDIYGTDEVGFMPGVGDTMRVIRSKGNYDL